MTIENIMLDGRGHMIEKDVQSYYMRDVKVNVSNINKIICIIN